MPTRPTGFVCPCLLLLLALPGLPVRAAPVDRYLPNDTDAVVMINVQQILASPLVKTHYQALLQEWQQSAGGVSELCRNAGIDLLKDVDQIILANGECLYRLTKRVEQGKIVYGSSGGYFFLIKGRFNTTRLHLQAEKLAQAKQDFTVKSLKVGSVPLYEIDAGRTLYVGFVDGTTIAVSSRSEPVVEALEKAAGKRKAALQYPEMATAIGRLDARQSLSLAVIGSAGFGLDVERTQMGGKVIDKPIKQMIRDDGIDAITGSIQVADGMSGRVTVAVQGATTAKAVAQSLQEDLNDGIDLTFNLFVNVPKLAPLAEFVRSIKIVTKDNKTVMLEAGITAKQVADALK